MTRRRYEKNPFTQYKFGKTGLKKKFRRSANNVSTTETKTGELSMEIAITYVLYKSDKGAKKAPRLYNPQIFRNQKPIIVNMMVYILENIGIGNDIIYLHPELVMEYLGVSHTRYVREAIKELEDKHCLALHDSKQHAYYINPHYFFRGDRMKLDKNKNDENDSNDPKGDK